MLWVVVCHLKRLILLVKVLSRESRALTPSKPDLDLAVKVSNSDYK